MNYLKKKKRTIIRNIEKDNIKTYINRIYALNKGVEVYKIRYNEIDKKLIVIANKRIQVQRVINKNLTFFKTLKDVKDEFNKLSGQDIIDEEYINLENIKYLFANVLNKLFLSKDNIEKQIEQKIKYIYGDIADIIICNYNRQDDSIKIRFTTDYKRRNYKPITIKFEDNDIKTIKSESKESNNILKLVNEEFKELFNIYKKFIFFSSEYIDKLRSTNSSIYVNVTLYNITIYNKDYDNIHFKINYSTYENKFYIDCNDDNLKQYLYESAPTLLKLIYIPIVECPEWCQEELYNIRDKELYKDNEKNKKKENNCI